MERRYSANPGERFFTAGGMHTFENFKREDNGKVVSVTEALRHSINLPFIRMMRDIVQYLTVKTHGYSSKNIRNMNQSQRKEYLEKFADKEGKTFISRFYGKYKGKSQNEILTILIDTVNRKPSRVATIFWFIFPEKTVEDFNLFIKQYIDHASINENEIKKYYRTYNEVAKNLSDKGYIARLHPLELWTASYLYHKPDSSLSEIFNVSKNERIEVYEWLMKTSRTHAQDSRIKTMLEAEAFIDIHERWKQTGYSLPYLVPSLATALGTSADRPDSLADLMGLILAEGIMYPKTSISKINIGKGTPFESSFEFNGGQKKRVLSSEVASIAKEGLLDIVSKGTAIRLKDGIKIGDEILQVGGKTGTGDHRYVIYRGGKKEKRVVNRTATFMFILGDRYYGVVSVLVPGIEAANFNFTSALPVQILKNLAPELENLRKDK
jgi:membrane peptidoglycan carboxypeptidase